MNYEFIITLLLSLIVYFLYQIAKQLSYITGVKIRFPWGQWNFVKHRHASDKKSHQDLQKEKLKN